MPPYTVHTSLIDTFFPLTLDQMHSDRDLELALDLDLDKENDEQWTVLEDGEEAGEDEQRVRA